jgi:hypothetical protein
MTLSAGRNSGATCCSAAVASPVPIGTPSARCVRTVISTLPIRALRALALRSVAVLARPTRPTTALARLTRPTASTSVAGSRSIARPTHPLRSGPGRPNAGADPCLAAHSTKKPALGLGEHDNFGIGFGDTKLIERCFLCFFERPAGNLHPLHALPRLSRSFVLRPWMRLRRSSTVGITVLRCARTGGATVRRLAGRRAS